MRRIVISLILALLLPAYAYPFCLAPGPRLVCAEYFKSKVVVRAKLVRQKAIVDKDGGIAANVYYMRTEEILRGAVGPEFEIYEGNDSGRAGFYWKNGHSYLLFLFPSNETNRPAWALDGCGNSGPLEQEGAVLRQIAGLKQRRGGMIQVAVGDGSISYPVEDVRVTVRGSNGSFSGVTNAQGRSEINVPAGHYSLTVEGKVSYEPYFLGYEQPNDIHIENGACAQVQFVEAGKN